MYYLVGFVGKYVTTGKCTFTALLMCRYRYSIIYTSYNYIMQIIAFAFYCSVNIIH